MCGIFGLISKKPRKFDYATFCTLGIHNDSRGGDSCGVFIDGKVEYGVKENKYFENFFTESKLVEETQECQIALGHCRKASVGAIDITTAQPVCITNNEGKIEFVVIHNGTIYNYKELAKTYIPDIDITGMTDSQVMTQIFYHAGYQVLSEYNGAAVFVIVDYRTPEPTTLFWQGASPNSLYGKPQEERPLYFAIKDDNLVFSSLATYIPSLLRDWDIYTLEPNWLFTFNGVELKSVAKYDREGMFQYNKTINYPVYNYGSTYTDNMKCFYSDLRFRVNNNILAHGSYKVSCFGTINAAKSTELWFWEGVVLKNKKCFNILTKICQSLGILPSELHDYYKECIYYLSAFPFIRCKNITEVVTSPLTSELFTGLLYVPFVNTAYNIVDGSIKNCITTTFDINFKFITNNLTEELDLSDEMFSILGIDESI